LRLALDHERNRPSVANRFRAIVLIVGGLLLFRLQRHKPSGAAKHGRVRTRFRQGSILSSQAGAVRVDLKRSVGDKGIQA
jgi:hypothetical protein